MKLSVIMVDGSFRGKFHSVDSFCRQTLSPDAYELLWVEYYDAADPVLNNKAQTYRNLRILTLNKEGIYHSSWCFNAGIRESTGDLLFIADADVLVEPDFLERALRDHEENPRLVMYFFRKEEPQEQHREGADLAALKKICRLTGTSNYGGCLSVRKKWLLEINGYEQHPVFGSGFHANGFDVYTRLKILGLHVRWHPELFLYHPWHPQTSRGYPAWEVQKIISNHRALNLECLAYRGLDPSKNRELPPELETQLEEGIRNHNLEEYVETWLNGIKAPKATR